MINLFLEGLKVTIFSMSIVFLVLIILMYVIKLQTFLLNKSDKRKVKDEIIIEDSYENQKEHISLDNDKEIVAVIAATLAMYMDTSVDNINIRNIKRINSSLEWRKSGIKSMNM
ncbi:sodium pump decarboxylase gamma subunit [Clostridium tetanomorphum]|uniref:OadG family protein n=1 Tax=Clostridium tetanomorphum TaxID=1553 RepID=A0A923J297_CLOTT|nr:OadG family protein [Clostridium tetanomorphum]KAJ49408.1 Sodium pump decarboxylase, gamma subunit [Clostridium tetanomorphum DSM 665]KAJ52745.1 Sodium pump decarboxylase, gamma subunit [Clostridium tetanomorphum DSM 665]MBC2400032.1 OadG family protein [Clostridium tetanomorphum]MBP1866480.1 sodium pump decarboxylase gamma subunit [Clostridium tetanomorphum]NRS86398.1 sodium pump decarboxylase gamma subunit [Clostridium tetanomorphum]